MTGPSITEFLLARIEEDENTARDASRNTVEGALGNWTPVNTGDEWEVNSADEDLEVLAALRKDLPRPPEPLGGYWGVVAEWNGYGTTARDDAEAAAAHIARHDPARVLAECAAKRAIIKSYESCVAAKVGFVALGPKFVADGMVAGLELATQYLAAVYKDHADYQEEWAA